MTDDHLSLDELAELDEGLLGADRATAARAHLVGCDSCRAKAASITATRSALSGLPAVSMPDEVRSRLDRALEAAAVPDAPDAPDIPDAPSVELDSEAVTEPRLDSGPAIDTGPLIDRSTRTSDVMPVPGSVLRPRFGRPTMASAAAAAAVVLALGAIIVAHYHHTAGTPSQAAGGTAALPGAANPELSRAQPSSVVKTSTGLDYTTANLAGRVRSVLARAQSTGPVPTASSTGVGSGSAPSNTGGAAGSGSAGGAAGSGSNTAHGGRGADSTAGTKAGRLGVTANTQSTVTAPAGGSRSLEDSPIPTSLQPLAHSQKRILSCAVALTGQPNAVPEQVDFARWTNDTYHHAPSAIFIFRGATASTVAVYVTNPTCSGNAIVRDFSQVSVDN